MVVFVPLDVVFTLTVILENIDRDGGMPFSYPQIIPFTTCKIQRFQILLNRRTKIVSKNMSVERKLVSICVYFLNLFHVFSVIER